MTISLSVIIPAYERLNDVLMCLNSLQRYASRNIQIEFIVCDDNSPSVNMQQLIPPYSARVLRNPMNLGFAGNCNTGAKAAQGDVLFFVNQDVFGAETDIDGIAFSQDWDIALVNAFDNPQVGIVGAKLLFPDGKVQNAGGLFDGHMQPYHIGLGYSNHRYHEVNTPREVSWTTGAALAIRRELFNDVGGFDTRYVGGYFEDVDLCLKVRERGLVVWYEPTCQLVHGVGSTGGNPHFMANARRFYETWVATGRITADTQALKERFW